jgi:hypothetical protein
MSTTPDDDATDATGATDAAAALRAERDALEARAVEAEHMAEQLAEELAATRERLAAVEAEAAAPLTLFEDSEALSPGSGADHGVLPVALGGVAFVLLAVGVLSLFNNGLFSPFTLLMLGVAGVLGWTAWEVRPQSTDVRIEDGVVRIERAGSSYRFDLGNDTCRVDTFGQPGDADWRAVFRRGRLEPFTVDASMVDAPTFVAELRKYRPNL